MTERQLQDIEAQAAAGHATPDDIRLLVAEIRMLRKLTEHLRDDFHSLERIYGETKHQ